MRPSNPSTLSRTDIRYAWGVCAFLLVVIALIYGQTLGHDLLDYDDKGYVKDEPSVTAGLTPQGIVWAFTKGPYGEWYPTTMLSHMLDCQLYGLNAWGHHLTNVLLHAAASIALFLVLWRMTTEFWPSAFVAAIFAVHPQHVESVAWIAERRDVLSGLFFMLTLGAYLGYVRRGRPLSYYLLVLAFSTLGLLAKPMLVTLPPLLLLLDFWPLSRFGSAGDTPSWTRSVERPGMLGLVLEKLPLVALAVGECLMTLRTHSQGEPLPLLERLCNAAVSCVTYVAEFFYPVDLFVYHPYPEGGPPVWKVAGALAILAAASAAAVIWGRRCPYFFVGWFWYLGMLAPVLGLVSVSDHAMADRYMYLPGIGLYIALAWGAARLAAGSHAGRWVLAACGVLAIGALVPLAARQTSFWRNEETLWRHTIACSAGNGKAELGLADILRREGRLEESIPYYYQAQKHSSGDSPYNNLGLVFARQGKLDEAIAQFRRALQINPKSLNAHANLGEMLGRQNRLDESIEQYRRALEIDPLVSNTHRGLAIALVLDQKTNEARAELQRAIELDPRNITARNDLATLLMRLGKIDEAIPQMEDALRVDPRSVRAHINLALAMTARGQRDKAMALYRQALEIEPKNPVARGNLDALLQGNAQSLKP